MLVMVRVDSRLIHAQVTEVWLGYLGADALYLAGDQLPQDRLSLSLMAASLPTYIKLVVDKVEKVVESLKRGEASNERAMLLLSRVEDALRVWSQGVFFDRLNIGYTSRGEGSSPIAEGIYLEEGELEILKKLSGWGVAVDFQPAPYQERIGLEEVLKSSLKKGVKP